VTPRGLSVEGAADYIGCSPKTILRLINAGHISIVRLPISHRRGLADKTSDDGNRRIIIDRAELDDLFPRWREKRL